MEIIGHKKQWDFLKKSAQSGRLAHACLFSGQEKLGKKTLALELACFLLNSKQKTINHPDFVLINGEKEIQISEIRELIRKISFKPSLAQKKVVIINNSHLMNQEGQTCFLKTLEEPRGDCLLILISDKPDFLLPTILSRLETIKFNLVSQAEIKKFLLKNDLSEEKAEQISLISSGRPGQAIDLAFNEQVLETFNQKIKQLNQLLKACLFSRFQYVKKMAEEPKEAKETLDVWLYFFRQMFLKNPTKKLRKTINLIEKTKYLILNTNVNSKLALERLVLEI